MTEEEMRKRIEEIDKIRYELSVEKNEYLSILRNDIDYKEYAERQQYVGKYFIENQPRNSYKEIIAIKILSIAKPPRQYNAECLAVADLCIKKRTLALWSADIETMLPLNLPKVISKYKEITKEEFDEIFKEQLSNMQKVGGDEV